MKETCANITINKRIGILKRMFKYHEINLPYLQKIGKLRERVHTYDMIELNDLMNIRSYVKQLPNNGNNLLYKVLILLLMDTGARINEILLTETKTKEDRVVYFQRTSMSYVKKMLDIENDHGYLLHNILKNRHSNYFDVDNYMRKLKKILSIKKLHAHMFRHSFATLWLQEGADINSVMKVMGHKNMETTQRYQHSNRKHIKTMYQKYKLDED
jgi:integrase/recombinase XerC/integrase/recombinase XerD